MNARWMLAIVGMFAPVLAARADGGSAYTALKTAQRTAAPSATLIEMMGERGEPRPQEWKVVFQDPGARGGIREISVSGDVVISERTPVQGYAGAAEQTPIVLNRLNLDSDGAFEIANKQAVSRRLGFNWVDYTLRTSTQDGAPMWVVRMYDHMGSQVGVTQISAENGAVLMPLEATMVSREKGPPATASQGPGGLLGRVGGTLQTVGNKVKKTTQRTVGNVQEFFTGERTVRPRDDDE